MCWESLFKMPGSSDRRRAKIGSVCFGLTMLLSTIVAAEPVEFGAYYTKINEGLKWEAESRTGQFADIVVRISRVNGELVFWRGDSYLPYWKTDEGRWNLKEIIPRSGDGIEPMPDRVNLYSHVEIITNTPEVVVVHWRYLCRFSAGNPRGSVNPTNFVDEVFTISPNGRVTRIVKKATAKIDDWTDPLNQIAEVLQLKKNGIAELSRAGLGHSVAIRTIKGNPRKISRICDPVLSFHFDEGEGGQTMEDISQMHVPIHGPKALWKRGVSGTALEFDGYHSLVSFPASNAPAVSGDGLTIEGWIALGAYPWNWVPIIQQGDDDGYFLGVDSHGYPGFKLKVSGVWQQLVVTGRPPYNDTNHLALFRWYQLAGTYDKGQGVMRLYLNGKQIGEKAVGGSGVEATNADIRLGKAGLLEVPTDGTHDTLPSEFGLDGLIDEVNVYNVGLNRRQVAESFASMNLGPAVLNHPDMHPRHLPNPTTNRKFEAYYTRLQYYETWDNMWCFGSFPDVVVGFDQSPTKFVFWRGVSFVPMMVNESNQWFTEEFNETGFCEDAPGDCEPMSDKACRVSHVRIIENNPARVVVQWRYRLANPSHHWAFYDAATGWGDISDWYFYIYPDGLASVDMRLYTSRPDYGHEWDEQIAVFGPGQHPEAVIRKQPVMTLVNAAGQSTDYNWNPNPPNPNYPGNIIQMIHFTGEYSPFAIQKFDGGDIYGGERTWYSVFPTWNHWPIAQINSSGRNASFPDRASHSSISHLSLPEYATQNGPVTYIEKLLMEGMTDLPAAALTNLAKSWLDAPAVADVTGGSSQGYSQPQRTYVFTYGSGAAPLTFEIAASVRHPIHNLCFEIRNWKSRTTRATLKIGGVSQTDGPNFRQGVKIDTDGSWTLIVWVGLSVETKQEFEVAAQ